MPSSRAYSPAGPAVALQLTAAGDPRTVSVSAVDSVTGAPLAGRISYFAPVSVLFFFFMMFIITALRGIELHPMTYFFLACAFFAVHLLLA